MDEVHVLVQCHAHGRTLIDKDVPLDKNGFNLKDIMRGCQEFTTGPDGYEDCNVVLGIGTSWVLEKEGGRVTDHLQRFAEQTARQEPIVFLTYIDDETNDEINITSAQDAFATLHRWRIEDLKHVWKLQDKVASLERALRNAATDMNGGA